MSECNEQAHKISKHRTIFPGSQCALLKVNASKTFEFCARESSQVSNERVTRLYFYCDITQLFSPSPDSFFLPSRWSLHSWLFHRYLVGVAWCRKEGGDWRGEAAAADSLLHAAPSQRTTPTRMTVGDYKADGARQTLSQAATERARRLF